MNVRFNGTKVHVFFIISKCLIKYYLFVFVFFVNGFSDGYLYKIFCVINLLCLFLLRKCQKRDYSDVRLLRLLTFRLRFITHEQTY